MTKPTLDSLMRGMEASWRKNWCSGGMCGCLGCANGSGRLMQFGYTKAEWQAWVDANPTLVSKEAEKDEMDAFIALIKAKNGILTSIS